MIKIGDKFNYLTVIARTENTKKWVCRCKCGKDRVLWDGTISRKEAQDCGCLNFRLDQLREQYIGKKYNMLTILDVYIVNGKKNREFWAKCKCDCGNICDYYLTYITFQKKKYGGYKSCGCLNKFNFDRDYKNKVYNDITIVDLVKDDKDNLKRIVRCKCHCGEFFDARLIDLTKHKRYIIACPKCNNSKYPKFNIKKRNEMHDGDIKCVFYGIKDRCFNKDRKDAKWYFDKGITVCDEWLNNTESFVKWAKENGYKKGLTIDRIDPNGNYCPENCRWVDMETQNNNQCNSVKYLCDGEYLSLAQISRKKNMGYRTLLARKNRGWSIEDIISTPIKHPPKKMENVKDEKL